MRKMHQQIAEEDLNSLRDDGLYFDGGIRGEESNMATLYNGPLSLDQIMNSFDYGSIGKENLKYVVLELRRHFVRYLEYHIAPCNNIWRKFIQSMAEMASIPLSSIENAEDITDIIDILKRGKFGGCHFRAYSCLMKTVQQINSRYSRDVRPLYNKIVMLDKQYRENVKAEMTSREGNNQLAEDDEDTTSLGASRDVFDDYFCLSGPTHSFESTKKTGCYMCGSKMYGLVSFESKICEGCKRSIPIRKRRITI